MTTDETSTFCEHLNIKLLFYISRVLAATYQIVLYFQIIYVSVVPFKMTMKLPDNCVIANQSKDPLCLLLLRSPKLFAAVRDMYGKLDLESIFFLPKLNYFIWYALGTLLQNAAEYMIYSLSVFRGILGIKQSVFT